MSLTLCIEDLSRYCISADFQNSSNGLISLALKPSFEARNSTIPQSIDASKTMIHFETVLEDGCYKLLVFASSDEEADNERPLADMESNNPSTGILSDHLNSMILGDHTVMEMETSLQQLTADWMPPVGGFGVDSPVGFLDFSSPHTWVQEPSLGKTTWEDLSVEVQGSLDEEGSPAPSTPSSSVSSYDECVPNAPHTGTRRPRRLNCLHRGCNRRFMSEYTRKLHMGTHKPKTRYTCEMGCDETFSRQHDRLRHEVAIHGRQVEWLCERCRRFFSCQATLEKHKCSGSAREVATRHTLPKT